LEESNVGILGLDSPSLKNITIHETCPPPARSCLAMASGSLSLRPCPPYGRRGGGREGAVIPGIYKNIHGEIVKIDLKTLDPDTEVMRF